MATTLAALVSKLRSEMKMDANDKIWSQSVKENAINEAYFQVQKDGNFDWPENQDASQTISLTAGTQEYALPSNTIQLTHVQLRSNRAPLKKTTREEVLRIDGGGTGTPTDYYIFGGNLGVYPKPDTGDTIDLVRRKRLTTLSTSQDSVFPVDFDEGIVYYAAYLLWKKTKNQQMAAAKIADYRMALNRLKMAYQFQDMADLNFGYQRNNAQRWRVN